MAQALLEQNSGMPPPEGPVHPKKRKLSLSQQIFDKLSHSVILINTAAKGDLMKLRLLVEDEKFNVNETDYDGRTPLHLAAEQGNLEIVKFLVQHGANVDVVDRWGTVPLRGALSFNRNDVVTYLREHGATLPYFSKKRGPQQVSKKEEIIEYWRVIFSDISQATMPSTTSPLSLSKSMEHKPLEEVTDDSAITVKALVNALRERGLDWKKVVVIADQINKMDQASGGIGTISFAAFLTAVLSAPESLLSRALKEELVIPQWKSFCKEVESIFDKCRQFDEGSNADYIPELAGVDSNLYALALVTVDGQVLELGDCGVEFSVQSTAKPLQYSICAEKIGMDEIHQYVGQEPSGVAFNAFTLNAERKPHNPLINSGAIMTSSLICPELDLAARFKFLTKRLSDLAGDAKITFSQPIYLSEKSVAHRNYALAHFMKSEGGFPPKVDILEAVDFYFQVCSCEVNCTTMASIASTYANMGRNPLSNKKVLSGDVVKNTIQLMYSCGMYDYSGEWACKVGIPAKSGVSGALMVVIPDKMGLAVFSPKLDVHGNSVRGIEFCQRFVKKFNWSLFDVMFSKFDNRAT